MGDSELEALCAALAEIAVSWWMAQPTPVDEPEAPPEAAA